MNKNTALILGIVAILIIGGAIVFSRSDSVSSTPAVETTTTKTAVITTQVRQSGLPILATSPRIASTDTTVVTTGSVNPNGAFTNYWYEYGLTANLGTKTSSQSVGSGYALIPTPAYVTGLTKDTTYYFRLV